MPILVKDYSWSETENEVELKLPLKGAKPNGVDVLSNDDYIKASYRPFFFEVQLLAPVLEEKCLVKIGNGIIHFRLVKKTPGLWGRLDAPDGGNKASMAEKRAAALAHAQQKAAEEDAEKVKQKREEEQFAIKQQMRLENEEKERIERVKQNERNRAMEDLDRWKTEKRKQVQKVKDTARHSTLGSRLSSTDIWIDKSSPAPPPRSGGNIVVHFTPRQFSTAARESTAQQEEEYLAKMAAARKIKSSKDDKESPNEHNPEFLKDRGIGYFKSGNYQAAINVFSEAISLNEHLPSLYSNRAACYLCTKEFENCITDCCKALELLFPVVPANYSARTKVFLRRGMAYAKTGQLDLALQDYDGAMKLSPDNSTIREDYENIKRALLAEQ